MPRQLILPNAPISPIMILETLRTTQGPQHQFFVKEFLDMPAPLQLELLIRMTLHSADQIVAVEQNSLPLPFNLKG